MQKYFGHSHNDGILPSAIFRILAQVVRCKNEKREFISDDESVPSYSFHD